MLFRPEKKHHMELRIKIQLQESVKKELAPSRSRVGEEKALAGEPGVAGRFRIPRNQQYHQEKAW